MVYLACLPSSPASALVMTLRSPQARRRQQRPRSPWAALLIPILAMVITGALFFVLASILGGGRTPVPTPTPTAAGVAPAVTPSPTPVPLPTPTATPTSEPPTPTPTATPGADVLRVGGKATVNAEAGLRVRSGPGTNFDPVTTLPVGTVVEIIGGPQRANTYTWWQIRFTLADGTRGEGWAAGDFLDPGAG